ncbi:phenazine-like biosynthesis protein [Catenovulum agarivorans DS-2]|uniref:Phenazine-like biosynthesis protein n=1 Tax=Catenovulum agarivorans DS-2 TaxID=1328313 RepID=W7QJ44_9ALTE|nr:PhzF family phenazine biosynthesis protein [Catenovulum agarivorans]EWH08153.1 phenazine-like biosynthesis protein [Catenovulum agarivorans DS-2]
MTNKQTPINLTQYVVNAFSFGPFTGNPAAIVPLESWIDDELMQKIAEQNNLSETCFFVEEQGQYHIRWFTPETEINLCGHATLASAFVLYEHLSYCKPLITFTSRSGLLQVEKNQYGYGLNFPNQMPEPVPMQDDWLNCFNIKPIASYQGEYLVLEFASQQQIVELKPNILALTQIAERFVVATAKGDDCDFVCRFFAPQCGINEDPVTGSAYTHLIPLWAGKLDKMSLYAKQLSKRGGQLHTELKGERVIISGEACLFSQGTIRL